MRILFEFFTVEIDRMKISFDGKVEKFRTTTNSVALLLGDFRQATTLSKSRKILNANTWKLLSRTSSVRQIALQAIDENGDSRVIRFDVSNSVPIAAKFNVLGCKSN